MSNLFSDFAEKNKKKDKKLSVNNGNVRQPYKGGGAIHGPRRGEGLTKTPQEQRRPDNSGFNKLGGLFDTVSRGARNTVSSASRGMDRLREEQERERNLQGQQSFAPLFGADQQAMIDDLLNNEYMMPRSAEDISSFARQGADEELANLMGVLDKIMGAAEGRYKESDQNLESMYGAHQEDVRTNSVAAQRDIAQRAGENTEQAANASVGNLGAAQSQQNAAKEAMLQNLGIQSAGGGADEFNALEEAQGQIQQGNARSQNRIGEIGAANEAATMRMADTIGLEGKGQRSALEQQFGQFGNEMDMQRGQYQQQHAQAMRELMMQASNQAQAERQQYGQFQYGIGSDMLNSEMDYVGGQAQSQAEAIAAEQDFQRKQALMEREYELEGGLARAKNDGRGGFDPMQETFKSMLGQDGADPQEVLQWYLQQMNQRR